jgi:hypothetical protein
MAKRKAPARPWEDARTVAADDFLEALTETEARRNGKAGHFVADEASRVVVGPPLPYLSQRLIYQSTVLPLGRAVHVFGPPESLKSCFLFDGLRQVLEMRKGLGFYGLTEPRDQPVMRGSIVRHPDLLAPGKFRIKACRCMEDWQDMCTDVAKALRKLGAPGQCDFPIFIGIDSLLGAASQKTIDGILEEGHASVGFSQEANILNIYLKVIFNLLAPWPVLFVGTNHQKFSKDKRGHDVGRTAGGASMHFYSTYELELRRIRDWPPGRDGRKGRQVKIKTFKNSTGDARLSFLVDVWYYVDEHRRQHTWWDWPAASVNYLLTLNDYTATETWKKKVQAVVDLQKDGQGDRVTSKALGLKKASFAEAGQAIEEDAGIRRALDTLFGVHEGVPFVPGIPYAYQLQHGTALDVPADLAETVFEPCAALPSEGAEVADDDRDRPALGDLPGAAADADEDAAEGDA